MSEIYWNTWVPSLLFAHAKEFIILPYKGFTKRDTRTYLVFFPLKVYRAIPRLSCKIYVYKYESKCLEKPDTHIDD